MYPAITVLVEPPVADQLVPIEPNHFDLVNSSLVAGGIDADRWGTYLRGIRRVLRPGGWCQLVEIYFNAQSDNATLTDGHALRRWSSAYLGAMGQSKNPRVPGRLAALMRGAGFREVEELMFPLPLCGWTNGSRTDIISFLFGNGTEMIA
ncbi:hypothetical protein DL766_000849 [Monosporascus sp. MC13-8B]|uniref:Methyltransferase type 11 domain-containing protein n=1 Tax=Monosporascus cannonballus TaxID=155416 RepID=A0ABY0H1F6_9PEZI|nr:hypothetical protein DL762_007031 [Monosporascus cannonballus]RYO94115.1 hypothetical protein DL763_004183 [Monosporascus cannonballus]RYP38639.1 hypothetical protein DL766_000849 [Monosporascus sp. MC13-8B]